MLGYMHTEPQSLHTPTRRGTSRLRPMLKAGNGHFLQRQKGHCPSQSSRTSTQFTTTTLIVALKYYGPAHTDSDVSVLFEEANVIHLGDTWWNGIYPFIDYSTGGNIDGMIQASDRNLKAVSDDTIIIPGHGPVGNKAALSEFRDMLVEIRHNVAELKKQGKSLKETIAAKPTVKYDEKFGQFLITPAFFTTLVYSGI